MPDAIENMAKDHDELCEQLREAIAVEQSRLLERTQDELIMPPSVQPTVAMETPQSTRTTDAGDQTSVEQEIARLEAALREHGCD